MVTRIFSLNIGHTVSAVWHKERLDGGIQMVARPNIADAIGLCAGTVAVWLKKSIATGDRGILSADELGPQHLIAIVQGAYELSTIPFSRGLDDIDSMINLLISQNLIYTEFLRGTGILDPLCIANWVLRKTGHCLFAFGSPEGDGHVLGMRYEGGILELLEPTIGLVRYTDAATFAQQFQLLISHCYPVCLGGEWGIFRVEASY